MLNHSEEHASEYSIEHLNHSEEHASEYISFTSILECILQDQVLGAVQRRLCHKGAGKYWHGLGYISFLRKGVFDANFSIPAPDFPFILAKVW